MATHLRYNIIKVLLERSNQTSNEVVAQYQQPEAHKLSPSGNKFDKELQFT